MNMYLIKEIFIDNAQQVKVENGIRIWKDIIADSIYKDRLSIHFDANANLTHIPLIHRSCIRRLTYVSNFIESNDSSFKKIQFNVSTYEPANVEGYIVFIVFPASSMITSGKKLFANRCRSTAIVLKDQQFLEIEGKRIKVVNNQLMLLL